MRLADMVHTDPDEWVGPENQFPGWEHLPLTAHHAIPDALWAKRLWELIQIRAGDDPEYVALVDV